MNLLLLFVIGLILITCLYGLWLGYVSSWFLIIGLASSSFVMGLLIGGF